MKKFLQPGIIAGLLLFVWFQFSKEPEVITVEIPAREGQFKQVKPEYITLKDTVYLTLWRVKDSLVYIETDNPVNDSLARAYTALEDSLERYRLFLEAIQIRDFRNTFEDSLLVLNVSGQVQGELNYLEANYTIKPRNVNFPKTKGRFLIGGQAGFSHHGPVYGLSVGRQTSSGLIVDLSILNRKTVLFGVKKPIFANNKQ